MTIDDVALWVSEALGAAGVPFMLVGGFSSNYHGIPRSTKDADFVARFRRRQGVMVDGRQVFFPTAEDVIIWKLRWRRAKDRDDVRAVIGVQGEKLDWPYIEGWCERHGTRALLEEIRRTVPKV